MQRKSSPRCARIVAMILLLGLCAARAFAQDDKRGNTKTTDAAKTPPGGEVGSGAEEIVAVPNRPTFATTAESVQRGVFEIEYGFEGGEGHQNINGLLKWGMFKNLELWFLNNPIERDGGSAGMGDSGAGFKYKVFPQAKARPTFSILYTVKLPTARVELGAGAVGHSVQILLSKDFGKHHFDANEGVQFVGRPGASGFDRNYFSSLSYSRQFTAKWGWTAELAGFSWTNAAAPATMTLLAAPTYNVTPRLVLDGGAYVAVYGNLPRVTGFLGVTYSVSDLYHLHPARKDAKN
jgi:Putative MetA-pathway of phenol degradation